MTAQPASSIQRCTPSNRGKARRQRPRSMYNESRFSNLPFMVFPQFMRITIAAASSLSAITYAPAQTTRVDELTSGSTITSLTQQTRPRAGTALDAIQAGADVSVNGNLLQASEMADTASAD